MISLLTISITGLFDFRHASVICWNVVQNSIDNKHTVVVRPERMFTVLCMCYSLDIFRYE